MHYILLIQAVFLNVTFSINSLRISHMCTKCILIIRPPESTLISSLSLPNCFLLSSISLLLYSSEHPP